MHWGRCMSSLSSQWMQRRMGVSSSSVPEVLSVWLSGVRGSCGSLGKSSGIALVGV